MKKVTRRLSYLIIFICFIGCEKEELPKNTNFSDNYNLARLWLENEYFQMAENVLWEHAKSIEFENTGVSMINVPVHKENNNIFEIIVFTISKNNIDGVIWTMVSENEGYDNTYYDLTTHQILENFSGILKVSKLSGQIESEIQYVDGSMEGVIRGRLTHMPSECDACHKAITLDEVVVTADGDGGDWWFDDPCSTYYDPCKCGGFGCEYIGGVVGGGSGNSAPINNWEEKKIDDSQLKPCMQKIMSDLKKLNQGVGQIIAKFSGTTPGYNWETADGILKKNNTASTSTLYNKNTGTVTSKFDSKAWPKATELSWARTILHESVHAYVVAVSYNEISVSQRQQLLGQDWATAYLNGGHDYMANNYVKPIADALQEFGNNKGYNHSRQFYEDMAWGGLQGTSAFNALSTVDKSRILNVIAIELTGKDSKGNYKNQKGTNAGC